MFEANQNILHNIGTGYGKPGNVREFDSCQGNVGDFTKSQGNVRKKILSGKSSLKLFILSYIFVSIRTGI